MKLAKGILETLFARRKELMGHGARGSPRVSDDDFDDEVTQKTNPDAEDLPFLAPKEIDELVAVLEPLAINALVPKFKNKRILYVTLPGLAYLPAIRGEGLPSVVCMGPEFSANVDNAPFPLYMLCNEYADPCFKADAFDVLILPETTCRGIHFITRCEYWSRIVAKGGDIYLVLPHPQLRFLFATRQLRHKSSRTATFERVFERLREAGLEIIALREFSASHVSQAALKGHPKWQQIKSVYEELPMLLGLSLRKRED